MALLPLSVYQRFPSGPAVMPPGVLPPDRAYSVRVPEVVFLPILPAVCSVNQMLLSGPKAIPLVAPAVAYSVMPTVGIQRISSCSKDGSSRGHFGRRLRNFLPLLVDLRD